MLYGEPYIDDMPNISNQLLAERAQTTIDFCSSQLAASAYNKW